MAIYQNIRKPNRHTKKLFNINIYDNIYDQDYSKKKYLGGVYKIVEKKGIKIYYFAGIKLYKHIDTEEFFRHKSSDLVRAVQRSITTALLHQKTFGEYKNFHCGQSVVLVGAGPTVNNYEPIENAVHVGLNRAFKYDKVNFDYLFTIDKSGIQEYYDDFMNYEGNNCVKFVGDQNSGPDYQIPESYVLRMNNPKRYKTTVGTMMHRFAYELATEPLGNYKTVSLQAIQFILFTNPKKVYIVGVDCTFGTKGHFIGGTPDITKRGEDPVENDVQSIEDWTRLKEFAYMYYPETEIISINPVGLRGIFKDVYTESFAKENFTEAEMKNIEIINDMEKV